MTYEQLEQAITDYFSDKSRTQSETRRDLDSLAEHCGMLAETLTDDSED